MNKKAWLWSLWVGSGALFSLSIHGAVAPETESALESDWGTGGSVFLPRGLWGWLVDRFHIRLVPVGYTLRQLLASQATTPKR